MQEDMKKAAGYAAAEWVEPGMIVGLGTGSTVFHFINRLIERVKQGLHIQVISSSLRSEEQARQGQIPVANLNTIKTVDLTVDGADEITKEKHMIKGGGGALLREKVLASISREMVVIVDESKVVERLGKHPLPVEILPFAHEAIIDKINKLEYFGVLRFNSSNQPFVTDNGNWIYDIHFDSLRQDPEYDHRRLSQIPGVLETGIFFNLAGRVLIGKNDGTVEEWL